MSLITALFCLSVTDGFNTLLGTFLAVSFIHVDETNYLFLGKRKSLCARLFGSTLMVHFMVYLKDSTLDFVHVTLNRLHCPFYPHPLASDLIGYRPKRKSSLSIYSAS